MSQCVGSALIQKGFKAAPDQYIGIFAQNRPEVMPGLPPPTASLLVPIPSGTSRPQASQWLTDPLPAFNAAIPTLGLSLPFSPPTRLCCSCKGQLSYLPGKGGAQGSGLVLLILSHTCLSSPSKLPFLFRQRLVFGPHYESPGAWQMVVDAL